MAGPIGLCVVGVDSHDLPVVPVRCANVRDPRRLPIRQSTDSIADGLGASVNRAVTRPRVFVQRKVFVQREGVPQVSSIRDCSVNFARPSTSCGTCWHS